MADHDFLYFYKLNTGVPDSTTARQGCLSILSHVQGKVEEEIFVSLLILVKLRCQFFDNNQPCPLGDGCSEAHNAIEVGMHPENFKRKPCKYGQNCKRLAALCFFSHDQHHPLHPPLAGGHHRPRPPHHLPQHLPGLHLPQPPHHLPQHPPPVIRGLHLHQHLPQHPPLHLPQPPQHLPQLPPPHLVPPPPAQHPAPLQPEQQQEHPALALLPSEWEY